MIRPGTDSTTVATVTAAFVTGWTTFIVGLDRSLFDEGGLESEADGLVSAAVSFESAVLESEPVAAGVSAVPALDDDGPVPESEVTVVLVDEVLDCV